MNDYSDQAVAQWIEDVSLLDAVVVRAYQQKYDLSYLETLSIAVLFFHRAKESKANEGLVLHGFKPYYFYSSILNQFEDMEGKPN